MNDLFYFFVCWTTPTLIVMTFLYWNYHKYPDSYGRRIDWGECWMLAIIWPLWPMLIILDLYHSAKMEKEERAKREEVNENSSK